MTLTHHAIQRMEDPDRPLKSTADIDTVVRYGRELPGRNGATKYVWMGMVVVKRDDKVITHYRRGVL